MEKMILDAAEIIAQHDTALANVFRNQPFNRVNMAYAFTRSLAKTVDADIHPHASAVLRVAMMDRDNRRKACTQAE